MKKLLFSTLLFSGFSFAQTNIIAAKSHASKQVIDKNNTDNFGLPNETRIVKRVEYLKDDCLIETAEVTMFERNIEVDTICDHPFLKEGSIDVDRIKAMYPEGTKFAGFDRIQKDQNKSKKQLRKEKHSKKSSGIFLLMISAGLFLVYLFVPKFTLKTS